MPRSTILALVVGAFLGCRSNNNNNANAPAPTAATADPSGHTEAPPGSGAQGLPTAGLACGLFPRGSDHCTDCTIERCCSESQTCAGDTLCAQCVRMSQRGEALQQHEAGCYQSPLFTALTTCVNDRERCGPICNPPAPCNAQHCSSPADCQAVGCQACGSDGRCQ